MNAITVARRHGANRFELISGPEVPVHEQNSAFRKLQIVREHADYAEVKVIEFTSDNELSRTFGVATVEAKSKKKKD